MATAPGGLTASIRRKLQEGRHPDEIVQELVAGGMSQGSAQRFVDRALMEDASSAPLAPLPQTAATPAHAGADQFQPQTATTDAETTKIGRKSLWVASALMCAGIGITGISFIMAPPDGTFTIMWGPVVFGFILWVKTVFSGLGDVRRFAWFSALGSLITPVVFAVFLLFVAVALEPEDDGAVADESAEVAAPEPVSTATR